MLHTPSSPEKYHIIAKTFSGSNTFMAERLLGRAGFHCFTGKIMAALKSENNCMIVSWKKILHRYPYRQRLEVAWKVRKSCLWEAKFKLMKFIGWATWSLEGENTNRLEKIQTVLNKTSVRLTLGKKWQLLSLSATLILRCDYSWEQQRFSLFKAAIIVNKWNSALHKSLSAIKVLLPRTIFALIVSLLFSWGGGAKEKFKLILRLRAGIHNTFACIFKRNWKGKSFASASFFLGGGLNL